MVKTMAYSGQEISKLLLIGQYKYEVSTRGLRLRRFSKSAGAQTELVGRIAEPDLMRHYMFVDIRASDLSYFSVMKWFETIPAEYIEVISEFCDRCRKHFMQSDHA